MNLERTIRDCVNTFGRKEVERALDSIIGEQKSDENTLTVIANQGVHHLPDQLRRGTVFVVTEGNLDFSTIDTVRSEYEAALENLASILKSKNWEKIYFVPFGHNTLAMQIKLLIYRVTRIESIDYFYSSSINYEELEIDQRTLITGAK